MLHSSLCFLLFDPSHPHTHTHVHSMSIQLNIIHMKTRSHNIPLITYLILTSCKYTPFSDLNTYISHILPFQCPPTITNTHLTLTHTHTYYSIGNPCPHFYYYKHCYSTSLDTYLLINIHTFSQTYTFNKSSCTDSIATLIHTHTYTFPPSLPPGHRAPPDPQIQRRPDVHR